MAHRKSGKTGLCIAVVSEYGWLGSGLALALGTIPGVSVPRSVETVSALRSGDETDLLLIHGDDSERVRNEVCEAKERFPGLECMVVLRSASLEQGQLLEEAGASLVISEDIRLLDLIRLIAKHASPKGTAQDESTLDKPKRARPYTDLTLREIEVAATIAVGLSNQEIAAHLNVRPSTVKNHVHNILTKLGLASRAELARYARRYGWILPSGSSTVPGQASPERIERDPKPS